MSDQIKMLAYRRCARLIKDDVPFAIGDVGRVMAQIAYAMDNAVEAMQETLEAYAKAGLGEPPAPVEAAASLAEAVEGHLAAQPSASLEPERPASRVQARPQLDEATLWGK